MRILTNVCENDDQMCVQYKLLCAPFHNRMSSLLRLRQKKAQMTITLKGIASRGRVFLLLYPVSDETGQEVVATPIVLSLF